MFRVMLILSVFVLTDGYPEALLRSQENETQDLEISPFQKKPRMAEKNPQKGFGVKKASRSKMKAMSGRQQSELSDLGDKFPKKIFTQRKLFSVCFSRSRAHGECWFQ